MFHPKGPTLRELIRQGLSSTKEGYDQLAPKFDYTPFLTSKEFVHGALAHLRDEKFERAIDLCTGTGAGAEGLAPLVQKEIVGIDWSEPMLEEAKKKFAGAHDPEIRFVCKDIFTIEFLKDYDLVTCFGALGHIPENRQREFTNLVYRLLRPGGKFVFVSGEYPSWSNWRAWPYFAFDAAMRVRNFFLKPEFVMYYINFLIPEVFNFFPPEKWRLNRLNDLEMHGQRTSAKVVTLERK